MARTRHFQKRMSQRGITHELVELVRQFGEPHLDKIVLDRKGLKQLLATLRDVERTTLKALDKGGVVVVEDGDSLITAYRPDSYSRKKARSSGRGTA